MSQEGVESEFKSASAEVPIEPTGFLSCPICSDLIKSRGQFSHFKIKHPDLDYHEYKDKFIPARPPQPERPPIGEPLYKGELDSTKILREVLSKHPDIPGRVVDEVISWADYGPVHPTQLVSLLSSMRGISQTTAYIVAQKYGMALQKAQAEGKVQLPPVFFGGMQASQQPMFPAVPFYQPQPFQPQPPQPFTQPAPQPQQQPWPQPYPWQPQQYPQFQQQPQPDLRSVIRDELRSVDDRLRRVEEPKPKEAEGFVEIEEPVRDSTGNVILGVDDKPIVKKMKVPAGQAGLYGREDAELKMLEKMKMYKDLFGEKEKREEKPSITRDDVRLTVKDVLEEKEGKLTPEQVIHLVEQKLSEKAKPEESPELQILRRELAETKERFVELKESMEKKEREALESEIRRLESDIRRVESGRVVEGYRADEYRFMGQGLDRVAGVLEKKEPIKIVIEKLPEITSMATGAVPQQPAPPQARTGFLEMLRQRGLTTSQ